MSEFTVKNKQKYLADMGTASKSDEEEALQSGIYWTVSSGEPADFVARCEVFLLAGFLPCPGYASHGQPDTFDYEAQAFYHPARIAAIGGKK